METLSKDIQRKLINSCTFAVLFITTLRQFEYMSEQRSQNKGKIPEGYFFLGVEILSNLS